MPKVNQKKIADDIQEIIISQFIFTITGIESPKHAAAFFSDFLTDNETTMLSKRLAIAVLLLRGHSQTLITKILSVSYSATGAVSSWMKNADPTTLLLLNTIARAEAWKEIVYNYKVTHKKAKQSPGRTPKPINPSQPPKAAVPSQVHTVTPTETQLPDFDNLEGPEIVEPEEEVEAQGPPMEDLLND